MWYDPKIISCNVPKDLNLNRSIDFNDSFESHDILPGKNDDADSGMFFIKLLPHQILKNIKRKSLCKTNFCERN